MKIIGLIAMLMLGGAAHAQLASLAQPALTGIGLAARTACVGNSFNADGSILGACRTVVSSPCSGRGCQPVTTTTNYIARWDVEGNATGISACATVRHHPPQADQTTYLNGHSAADCTGVVFIQTGTVVVIDGTPFYYVSTSATGNELVNSNTAGYLYVH